MSKFRCPQCHFEQDVPFGGWHWEGEVPGKQHFIHRGVLVPDPRDPLRLICQDGYDPKMLTPICWECGVTFDYVRD
jgi:hypothetical protein